MSDQYGTRVVGLSDPAIGAFAITPDDATVFTQPTRSLWIGGIGNITVVHVDATQVTYSAVPAGTLLPLRVKQVKATGTTASLIIGMY